MALTTLTWSVLLCVACSSWLAAGLPSPAHTMMVHGFLYRQPGGYYNPHAAGTSAFASRRSYSSRTALVNEIPEAEPPAEEEEKKTPAEESGTEETPVEEVTPEETTPEEPPAPAPEVPARMPKSERDPTPTKPSRKVPKVPKRRPVAEEDEEEDDEDYTPSLGRRSNVPTYSNFFPIIFGSRTANRRSGGGGGDEEDALQGPGLTAIANSFSTGRGAIAASHATAYGGPAPNPMRKGSPSRYRS